MKKNIIYEVHYIRTIACLFVLAVHVSAAFFLMQGEQFNWFTYLANQLGRFGTPMFAVISGFLLFYQVRRKGFFLKNFIASRTVKIISPFLVWSIFYVLLKQFLNGEDVFYDLSSFLFQNVLMGNAYYHLYFMVMVVQFFVLFPFLQMIRSKKAWPFVLIFSILMNYFYLNLSVDDITFGSKEFQSFILGKGFVLRWIGYFMFGGFIAYYWEEIVSLSKKVKKYSFLILGLALVIATIEYQYVGSITSYRPMNLVLIPIVVISITSMYQLIYKNEIVNKFVTKIGDFSMGIYLTHPFVLFTLMQVDFEWRTRLFPLIFIITLLLSVLITKTIQFLPISTYIIPMPKMKKDVNYTSTLPSKIEMN